MEKLNLPKNALNFSDAESIATFSKEDDVENLEMVVYSGNIIKNHWYWGNLGIDLEGLSFSSKKFPVLEDHETSKKIGFSKKPIINEKGVYLGGQMVEFVDTEESIAFRKLAKQGFPYQASISVMPTEIEYVKEGETLSINNKKLKGPGTVFRKSEYREGSVCVFGWDNKTSSTIFADNGEKIELNVNIKKTKEVKKMPNKEIIEKFQEENPEAFEELKSEIEKTVKSLFSDKSSTEVKEQVAQIEAKFTAEKEGLELKVTELEKKEALREIAAMKSKAESILALALVDSEIPKEFHSKIIIKHADFIENGVFNEEAYKTKVSEEIKDWEEKISAFASNSTVVGGIPSKDKDVSSFAFTDEMASKEADKLFSLV